MLQRPVFKQRLKRLERWIAIGNPQQQQFFQSCLAVRQAVCSAFQPFGGADVSAKNRGIRKLLGKGKQQLLQLVWFELLREPAHCLGKHRRIGTLAVLRHQRVAQFVDEPHGEQRSGVIGPRRIGISAASLVQRFGQPARCRHVREDDIARVAEQSVLDLGCFTDGTGDMEFHGSEASESFPSQYRSDARVHAFRCRVAGCS